MNGMNRRVSLVFLWGVLTAAPFARSQGPSPEAQPEDPAFLVEALSHPESRIRQNAATQLVKLGEQAVPALLPVMRKGNEFQTASAAIVLSSLKGNANPIPAPLQKSLYDMLSDPGTDVWRWNITATLLVRIAEDSLKNHVELWTWGVNHPSPLIGNASLLALQKTGADGKPAQAALLELLHRQRLPLTSVVLKPRIITDGLIGFEQVVPDDDPLLILETLMAIQADPQVMVEPLIVLMHHPSEYVRVDAAFHLAKLDAAKLKADPKPEAARVLADLALLPWGQVRELAVRRLGEIGEPPADVIAVLARLLEDKNGDVRREAAIALGNIGPTARSAVPALKKAIRFSELDTEATRNAMIEALKKIEPPEEKKRETSADQMI